MFSIQNNQKAIDISWSGIIKVVLSVLAVYFLFLVKDILFWVLSGLIISILFNPAINFLRKFKISRGGATALVYLSLLGLLFFMVYWVVPVFKNEIYQISQGFPQYFNNIAPVLSEMGFDVFQNADTFFGAMREWVIKISTSGFFGSISVIFGGVFLTITVFSLAVFFSLEEDGIKGAIKLIVPKKNETAAIEAWNRTQVKISGWFLARFLSMLFIGVMVSLLCLVLGVKYPLFFGMLAFITAIVPFIGPLFCGAVMILFVLFDAWQKALLIGAGIIIIHQIEGNIVTPMLTKRFMEFPATLVLISLLVGQQLWGTLGAILAIPLFGIVYDVVHGYLKKNKE